MNKDKREDEKKRKTEIRGMCTLATCALSIFFDPLYSQVAS